MKIKKLLTVLLTSLLLLTLSSSVFASEITPMATGIGDTQERALSLVPNSSFDLYLSNGTDEDWFKWTNDTGVPKKVTGFLNITQPQYNLNSHRLGLLIKYSDGSTSSILYSNFGREAEGHHSQNISNVYLPPGATAYFVVDSVKFVALSQYTLQFYVD